MRPEVAIQKLEELKAEAENPHALYPKELAASWKARVRAVVARSLGPKHDLVDKLDNNRYGLMMATSGTPDSAWIEAFSNGVQRAAGYVDAAIYELDLLRGDDEPVDIRSFDLELWDHVKALVEDEDWGKVASQVSIFVESHVRGWTDLGPESFGKGLYATAMGDAGELRLGTTKSEWEGWRSLAVGFAQAIGNVARHRIESRADARRYAIGVLGLGSLLLTQIRYEHDDLIEEREATKEVPERS